MRDKVPNKSAWTTKFTHIKLPELSPEEVNQLQAGGTDSNWVEFAMSMERVMSRFECYHIKHRTIIESD